MKLLEKQILPLKFRLMPGMAPRMSLSSKSYSPDSLRSAGVGGGFPMPVYPLVI